MDLNALFDRLRSSVDADAAIDLAQATAIVDILVLAAYSDRVATVAELDGVDAGIRQLALFPGYPEDEASAIWNHAFRKAEEAVGDNAVMDALVSAASTALGSPQMRELCFALSLGVVAADEARNVYELALLRKVANLFGIGETRFDELAGLVGL